MVADDAVLGDGDHPFVFGVGGRRGIVQVLDRDVVVHQAVLVADRLVVGVEILHVLLDLAEFGITGRGIRFARLSIQRGACGERFQFQVDLSVAVVGQIDAVVIYLHILPGRLVFQTVQVQLVSFLKRVEHVVQVVVAFVERSVVAYHLQRLFVLVEDLRFEQDARHGRVEVLRYDFRRVGVLGAVG